MVDRFALYGRLHDGSAVLDAGFGSGRDSLYMSEQKGFSVSSFDASLNMVNALKLKSTNIDVFQDDFLNFDSHEKYDGIWCCASLLHVKPSDFENALTRLVKSLRTGGILYFSIKDSPLGLEEWEVSDRTFYHPGKDKISLLSEKLHLSLIDFFMTGKIDCSGEDFENYFFRKN